MRLLTALLIGLLGVTPAASPAAELVMVEEAGCVWCARWNADVAPIYPKTPEGRFAPLRRIDKNATVPADLTLNTRAIFTPTFILIEAGNEVGRIEGYPGEDFFWGLLEQVLLSKTNYERPSS